MPHFGQSPGSSDSTPGHIGQKYFADAEGVTFPAGSFIITGSPADLQAAKTAVESLGLTAASLASAAVQAAEADLISVSRHWPYFSKSAWSRVLAASIVPES